MGAAPSRCPCLEARVTAELDGLGPVGRQSRRLALTTCGSLLTMVCVTPGMIPNVLVMALLIRLMPRARVFGRLRMVMQGIGVDYAMTQPAATDPEAIGLMLATLCGALGRADRLKLYRSTQKEVRRRMRWFASTQAGLGWWA